eukprot:343181_1
MIGCFMLVAMYMLEAHHIDLLQMDWTPMDCDWTLVLMYTLYSFPCQIGSIAVLILPFLPPFSDDAPYVLYMLWCIPNDVQDARIQVMCLRMHSCLSLTSHELVTKV